MTICLFQVVRASDVIKPSPDNGIDDGETWKLHPPVNPVKPTEKETKVPVAADQSCQVFCVAINRMWAMGQADGTKTMECSNGWGRFNKVQENDLVIITIVGMPGNPVVAVGEALAPPTVNVSDAEILRPMVLPERFDDLKVYLSGGKRKLFDFIRMKRVFDARSLNLKADELINNIGASKLRPAWQQRFEPLSGGAVVYESLLEQLKACPCHQHVAQFPAPSDSPATPAPAAAPDPPPATEQIRACAVHQHVALSPPTREGDAAQVSGGAASASCARAESDGSIGGKPIGVVDESRAGPEENLPVSMRLPWDIVFRIMRLTTTVTDGKIQRMEDGLPVGWCLANKMELLAHVAVARERRAQEQRVEVRELRELERELAPELPQPMADAGLQGELAANEAIGAPCDASGVDAQDTDAHKRAKGPLARADYKYRDQLQHAYRLLQEAIGSVIAMDELMSRPGSEPLRDLLKDPRAAQLQEVKSAQTALEMVTRPCSEEGVVLTARAAAAERGASDRGEVQEMRADEPRARAEELPGAPGVAMPLAIAPVVARPARALASEPVAVDQPRAESEGRAGPEETLDSTPLRTESVARSPATPQSATAVATPVPADMPIDKLPDDIKYDKRGACSFKVVMKEYGISTTFHIREYGDFNNARDAAVQWRGQVWEQIMKYDSMTLISLRDLCRKNVPPLSTGKNKAQTIVNLIASNLPEKRPPPPTLMKPRKAQGDSSKVRAVNASFEMLPPWESTSPGSSREDVTFDALKSSGATSLTVPPTLHDVEIPMIAFTKFENVDQSPVIAYLLGDEFPSSKGRDAHLKVNMVYIPRNQDVHTAAGYPNHCEEMKKRLNEIACSEEKMLKIIGCMYSRGFPNTVQHVQRFLQLNDARAVTCVMKQDNRSDDTKENWLYYQLTEEGLEFWIDGVPNDEYQTVDKNGKPLFREVEVALVCPLLEQTGSQV